jgi:hypothetical protein
LAGLAQETTATGPQNTWAQYQVILQRNIFSRQRGPVRQRQRITRPTRPIVVPNPESYFLLKGIVQEGGKFIAFLEDTQNNGILRLYEGDSVARGVVKNFTLDSIEYEFQDKSISVTMGQDLEGGQGTVPMSTLLSLPTAPSTSDGQETAEATQTAESSETAESVGGETPASMDEAAILKQLMEKRQQQLGQ